MISFRSAGIAAGQQVAAVARARGSYPQSHPDVVLTAQVVYAKWTAGEDTPWSEQQAFERGFLLGYDEEPG